MRPKTILPSTRAATRSSPTQIWALWPKSPICVRSILDKYPRSGHCPIIILTHAEIKISSFNKKRRNFQKANWNKLTTRSPLNSRIQQERSPKHCFQQDAIHCHKSCYPTRGQYIPCWDADWENAITDPNNASERDKAEKWDSNGSPRWKKMERVHQQYWLHPLKPEDVVNYQPTHCKSKPCPVTANLITSVLVGKWKDLSTDAKEHDRHVNAEIKEALVNQLASSDLSGPISTINQLFDAIMCLNRWKSARFGTDQVHSEFFKHLGLKAMERLRLFVSNCIDKVTIPKVWRQANVIAILKPEEPVDQTIGQFPSSPSHKLMERVVLVRINDIVEICSSLVLCYMKRVNYLASYHQWIQGPITSWCIYWAA